MKKTIRTSIYLLAITLSAGSASAAVIVGFGASAGTGVVNFTWNNSGFTLDNSVTESTSNALSVAATNDVEAFSFILTLTSLTAENLSNHGNTFLSTNNELMNMVGEGISFEISGISNSNVQFDGFTSSRIGGNGGGDSILFASGANELSSASSGIINLDPTLYLNGTEISLEAFGGGTQGTRINQLNLQFSAVPEPSSTALLGLGGLALISRRRR